MKFLLSLLASALSVNAYWLMGAENILTTQRMDPLVDPGKVSAHSHSAVGGSNFGFNVTTAQLRESVCTSIPIPQDKSIYWFPHLYFQWKNGSFSSLTGGVVIYYLFSNSPGTTAFPDNFRMLSGDNTLRTYNASSFAQQAVTFLCLDFNGVSVRYNSFPPVACPNGIRAQINFPSCWDGKNLDSPDHKSHVAFLSTGPDSGTCTDPKFPVTLPRIFMEVYWASNVFDPLRPQAMNSTQPFVYSYGDPTGYGYHADFINGWDEGVLQNAVDNCNCDDFGNAQCCADKKIFDLNQGLQCHITNSIDEQTTGTLLKLPGNNPVQPEGKTATVFVDAVTPPLISPVFAYTGNSPTATGHIVTPRQTNAAAASPVAPATANTPAPPKPISSSHATGPTTHATSLSSHATGPTTHATSPTIPPPNHSPSDPVLVAAKPTVSHSTQPAAATPIKAASPDTLSDPPMTCNSSGVKKRQLDYHRHHHRRTSNVQRHNFLYEEDMN